MYFLISIVFFCFFSKSSNNLIAIINNDDQKILSVQSRDLVYFDDYLMASNEISNLINSEILEGEFVYSQNYQNKTELRGVCLNTNNIFFIGAPYYLNENNNTFNTWGKRTNKVFFLNSYKNEKMFDYILFVKNQQQMQVFSVETQKLYRQITTSYTVKIDDSYTGLEEKQVQYCPENNRYRWREFFLFTINFLNRSYHFRYRVKDGTIILFHDGTKKLDLKDSKYFSGTNGRFFYFGSKNYIVDKSNDRVFYLIKNKDDEVIGTVFMGFLSQDFKAMLDCINASSDNEKKVDSLIELLEGSSSWIRLKIICMTYFFKIKHHLNLLFQHYLKKLY